MWYTSAYPSCIRATRVDAVPVLSYVSASTTEGLMIAIPAETECEDLHGYDTPVFTERVVLGNMRWRLERHVSHRSLAVTMGEV